MVTMAGSEPNTDAGCPTVTHCDGISPLSCLVSQLHASYTNLVEFLEVSALEV